MIRNNLMLVVLFFFVITLNGCTPKVDDGSTQTAGQGSDNPLPRATQAVEAAHENTIDENISTNNQQLDLNEMSFIDFTWDNLDEVVEILHIAGGWSKIEISPDGKYFAAWNGTNIWLYDLTDLNSQPELVLSGEIWNAAWSPSDPLLAVSIGDRGIYNVILFNPFNGKTEASIDIGQSPSKAFGFSLDGKYLAIPLKGTMGIYDVNTGNQSSQFQINATSIDGVKWNPSHNKIALCSLSDENISVYDTKGNLINKQDVSVCRFFWSSNSIIFVDANRSSQEITYQIWDPESGNMVGQLPVTNSDGDNMELLDVSLDGQKILYQSNSSLSMYELSNKNSKEIKFISQGNNWHSWNGGPSDGAKWFPNEDKVIGIGSSNIAIYDFSKLTSQSFRSPYLDFTGTECLFTKPTLIMNNTDYTSLNLWDLKNAIVTDTYQNEEGIEGVISISPNRQKILLTIGGQGSEKGIILDASNLEVIHQLDHPFVGRVAGQRLFDQNWISNDQFVIANVYEAVFVDSTSGKELSSINWDIDNDILHDDAFITIQLSPDNTLLAVSIGKYIFVVETQSKTIVSKWTLDTDLTITDIAWFPSSEGFAVSIQEGRISFWGVDGEKIKEDYLSSSPIFGIAFSPSSNLLAFNEDYALKIMSQDFTEVETISPWAASTSDFMPDGFSISWSPDGTLLAVCGNDGGMLLFGATK